MGPILLHPYVAEDLSGRQGKAKGRRPLEAWARWRMYFSVEMLSMEMLPMETKGGFACFGSRLYSLRRTISLCPGECYGRSGGGGGECRAMKRPRVVFVPGAKNIRAISQGVCLENMLLELRGRG